MDDKLAETLVNKYALMEFYSQTDCPTGNNVRYAYFRIYKRKLLYDLFTAALRAPGVRGGAPCRLLDCGCGFAADLEYIVCRLTDYWKDWPAARGIRYHGIDADERAVAFAHRHWARLSLDAEFRTGDLTAPLPYPDGLFDIAICSEVVEHLERPGDLLREIRRVLKKGGMLILTTNNKPTVPGRIKSWFAGPARDAVEPDGSHRVDGRTVASHGHIHMRTTGYWENLCRQAGFRVAAFGSYESVQRSGANTPFSLFLFFLLNFAVSLMPRRLGRYFGCTTALLCRAD